MVEKSLPLRLRNFTLVLGVMLLFVYGALPLLTRSCPPLQRMADSLDDNGIDPTRWYFTDVEQVKESERHLNMVLRGQ
jgi:hypothetical protein